MTNDERSPKHEGPKRNRGAESSGKILGKIQRARPKDHSVCARIMAGTDPWIKLGRGYEENLRALRNRTNEVFVVVKGGKVAGLVVLHLHGPLNGYIRAIAVAEEWRNCGLGARLVVFAEERIFRQSPNVFLCVSSFNRGAQRLYRRLGYRKVGELKDYVVRGYSEILMRKTRGPIKGYKGWKTKTPGLLGPGVL